MTKPVQVLSHTPIFLQLWVQQGEVGVSCCCCFIWESPGQVALEVGRRRQRAGEQGLGAGMASVGVCGLGQGLSTPLHVLLNPVAQPLPSTHSNRAAGGAEALILFGKLCGWFHHAVGVASFEGGSGKTCFSTFHYQSFGTGLQGSANTG